MKRRSTAITSSLSILPPNQNQQQQQQMPKTEAKSHQNSISKGSNPISRDRVELMHVSADERIEIPVTELMDQSHPENIESKSNLENETSLSNLQSTTTHLEADNDTITPRDRSASLANQVKSTVNFLFFSF